jgi:epoxyqueuosine reductase QueG
VKLDEHPTVKRYYLRKGQTTPEAPPTRLDSDWVRHVVLDAGADDAGFASIDNPVLDDYRGKILRLFPEAKTCVSVVCRMNPENIRSTYRQQYEAEYHHMYKEVDDVARRAAVKLADQGIRAMDIGSSYPMNYEYWPNHEMWCVSHKPIAVACGMGRMGTHHLVVHERFGSFIALASILLDREVTSYGRPLDYDPCCKCELCVTVCPVGAINADGHYNAIACYTHSYRQKYGGFVDWIEKIVASRTPRDYRAKFTDQETVLIWQGLSFGSNYMCTNCMAVCPGGDDRIGPYVENQKAYRETVAKKLQDRRETVYVVKGSDADAHVRRRFPHKPVKYVQNGAHPSSADSFLDNLPILFQRGQSKGLSAVYHLSFTGNEHVEGTVVIRDKTIAVSRGHAGTPDLRLVADSRTWLDVLAGDRSFLWALLTRKIRIQGPKHLFKAFVRCFPA